MVGGYTNLSTKIEFLCKKCNYIWLITPGNISRNQGCPKCSGHYTPTFKEFTEIISKRNIKIISKYKYLNTKSLFECLKCGHQWTKSASKIFHGMGCKKCLAKSKIFPKSEFENILKTKPFKMLGEYVKLGLKIEFLCEKCNHRWMTTPARIKYGGNCPECSKIKTSMSKYKNKKTTLYVIQFNGNEIKIGVTQKTVKQRYQYENIIYNIIEEIVFEDGYEAFKLEQLILSKTIDHKKYKNASEGPLSVGNTEMRGVECLESIQKLIIDKTPSKQQE